MKSKQVGRRSLMTIAPVTAHFCMHPRTLNDKKMWIIQHDMLMLQAHNLMWLHCRLALVSVCGVYHCSPGMLCLTPMLLLQMLSSSLVLLYLAVSHITTNSIGQAMFGIAVDGVESAMQQLSNSSFYCHGCGSGNASSMLRICS